jgi:hypothetical protein
MLFAAELELVPPLGVAGVVGGSWEARDEPALDELAVVLGLEPELGKPGAAR